MARDYRGWSPLHFAVSQSISADPASIPRTIRALLAAGADIMARDEGGWRPLHSAAGFGTTANIQTLLDAGADAKAKEKEGKTPWDLAQENEDLKNTKAYRALNDAQYK